MRGGARRLMALRPHIIKEIDRLRREWEVPSQPAVPLPPLPPGPIPIEYPAWPSRDDTEEVTSSPPRPALDL